MGIPRMLLLKQWLTKPTYFHFQEFTKPFSKPHLTNNPLLQTRAYSSSSRSQAICDHLQSFSPQDSAVPLLEKYYEEGISVNPSEFEKIIRKLRFVKQYHHALEVSEWASNKFLNNPDSDVLALRLDLTSMVHGVDAAERFFNEVNVHSQAMYDALLNCYVRAELVDKSLSLLKKMKDMGLAKARNYNRIMSLYKQVGKEEKILELLTEMEENGVSPDYITFNMCLKICALKSDVTAMEKILTQMESQPNISMDWSIYCIVANYFVDEGCPEKALYCLQQAEEVVSDNSTGCNNLISTYAKLRDVVKVKSLWEKHRAAHKKQSNDDYMVIISALIKLDEFEEAERVLKEWESSGNPCNFLMPDTFLSGFSKNRQTEKAEKVLEDMIRNGKTPPPSSWGLISEGHVKGQNMEKAVQCMVKALQLAPQHRAWKPKKATVSSILDWLSEHEDFEQVNNFVELLSTVIPMSKRMFLTLLRTSVRHRGQCHDILQRMKDHNIDVDDETTSIIKSIVDPCGEQTAA